VLELPVNFLKFKCSYYASLESSKYFYTDMGVNGICTNVNMAVEDKPLKANLFTYVYEEVNQPRENAMGGRKHIHLGIDIANVKAAEHAEEMNFYVTAVNPRNQTPGGAELQYLLDWRCRYWEKDIYRYWKRPQTRIFVDAPKIIVTEDKCDSGDVLERSCMKTWGQENESAIPISSPKSFVIMPGRKFTGKSNFTFVIFKCVTFEFHEQITDFVYGQPTGYEMRTTVEQESLDLQQSFKWLSPSTFILRPDLDSCQSLYSNSTMFSNHLTLIPVVVGFFFHGQNTRTIVHACAQNRIESTTCPLPFKFDRRLCATNSLRFAFKNNSLYSCVSTVFFLLSLLCVAYAAVYKWSNPWKSQGAKSTTMMIRIACKSGLLLMVAWIVLLSTPAEGAKFKGWLPGNILSRGTRPEGRTGYGMAYVDDLAFLFGGTVEGTPVASVYVMSPTSITWSDITSTIEGSHPAARMNMGFAASLNGIIFMFGGISTAGTAVMSDLWTLDVRNLKWSELLLIERAPSARHSMGFVSVPN